MIGGSGASAAKREAKRKQTEAYMKALSGVDRAPEVQQIDTNATRTLKENAPDISYNTLRLAIQADKIARKTNEKLPEINKSIGLYNDRFDKFQRQRAGESVVDGYKATGTGQNIMGATINEKVFNTEAEAASQAVQKPSGLGGLLGGTRTNSIQDLAKPTSGAQPIVQGKIDGNYRNLAQTQDAYDDFQSLTENVNKTSEQLNINAKNAQYEALANRIRASVKRNQANPQSTGLLQSEVLTGKPTSEVIR